MPFCHQADFPKNVSNPTYALFSKMLPWEGETARRETVFAPNRVLKGRVSVTANADDFALDVCCRDDDSRYTSCAPT
jgi:hypothetical protein